MPVRGVNAVALAAGVAGAGGRSARLAGLALRLGSGDSAWRLGWSVGWRVGLVERRWGAGGRGARPRASDPNQLHNCPKPSFRTGFGQISVPHTLMCPNQNQKTGFGRLFTNRDRLAVIAAHIRLEGGTHSARRRHTAASERMSTPVPRSEGPRLPPALEATTAEPAQERPVIHQKRSSRARQPPSPAPIPTPPDTSHPTPERPEPDSRAPPGSHAPPTRPATAAAGAGRVTYGTSAHMLGQLCEPLPVPRLAGPGGLAVPGARPGTVP
jgi:hypothetical protein